MDFYHGRLGYPGGVKLTTKELRDYFATQVSAQVTDPNTVMKLLRHTSLNTTSRYTRTVMERMKDAVQNLGQPLEATQWSNQSEKALKPPFCANCSRSSTESDLPKEVLDL